MRRLDTSRGQLARAMAAAIGLRIGEFWRLVAKVEKQNEVERLLDAWFQKELKTAWAVFHTNVIAPDDDEQRALQADAAENSLELLRHDYQRGRYAGVPQAILGELDAPIDPAAHAYTVLAIEVSRALGEVSEAMTRWSAGQHDYRPKWQPRLDPVLFPPVNIADPMASLSAISPAAATPSTHAPPPPPTPKDDTPSLSEAMTEHLHRIQRERNVTPKDIGQTETHLRAFIDAMGADRTIGSITRREAGEFFRAVQDLPAGYARKKDFAGLNVFDASRKARRMGCTPMNPRTVNSRIGDVRAMFGALMKIGVLDANPFDGMSMGEAGYAESEKPWTPSQLEAIFTSSITMGCVGERDVFTSGPLLLDDWRFWALLIALTSGARIGEIAQLRPIDVFEEEADGKKVWIYDIGRTGGRRTKNRASIRRTPIHSELIRIGVLRLAERQRAIEAPTLLPNVPKPVQGSHSHGLTKWMGEQLRPRLVADAVTGQGWHSFRHNLQDFSRAASNPDSVSDRIAGRTPEGAGGRYGRFGPAMLQDALEKIEFPAWIKNIPPRS
ncbi:hypothetical protein A0U90_11020 [Kozakia baliensis]|nr:hypothetical protein A0U90_11020 [Kozakia baliensis]